MVAEIAVVLIQCLVVPIVTELVKAALKRPSSGEELKELVAGVDEIKSMVDLQTMSLRRDPMVIMESLRRLKRAAETTESILGHRRTTGKAMGCSIDYLSGNTTQLLPQDSEGVLPSVRLFVQGMESDLQKENVEPMDPVRQTLRRVERSVASLSVRRPAEEHRQGYVLRRTVREGLIGPAEEPWKGTAQEPQRENGLPRTAEESPYGKSLFTEHVLSKPAELSSYSKSLRMPILSKTVEPFS